MPLMITIERTKLTVAVTTLLSQIEELDLCDNHIGQEGMDELISLLRRIPDRLASQKFSISWMFVQFRCEDSCPVD